MGFPVTTRTAGGIVDYLASLEQVNLSVLAPQRVSHRLGWQGQEGELGFLLGRSLVTAAGDFHDDPRELTFLASDWGEHQLALGFHRAGKPESWQAGIKPLFDFPRVVVGLLVSLSTPLLRILGAPNPVLSWSGKTSLGKTTSLRVAASVWGNPDETQPTSVVRTWDATRVYLERARGLLHGIPLFLDETSLARDAARLVTQIIYGVGGGQGRGRGSSRGMQRSWMGTTALLSTGEQPLTSFSVASSGTHARVLDLWGAPFGDGRRSDLVADLQSCIFQNFGHAGPAFVRYLLRHREDWSPWRTEYEDVVRRYQREAGINVVCDSRARLRWSRCAVGSRLGHGSSRGPLRISLLPWVKCGLRFCLSPRLRTGNERLFTSCFRGHGETSRSSGADIEARRTESPRRPPGAGRVGGTGGTPSRSFPTFWRDS